MFEKFQQQIKDMFLKTFMGINWDPVKQCKTYIYAGCAHVDGILCNSQTCPYFNNDDKDHPFLILLKNVPQELYDNNIWVREVCSKGIELVDEVNLLKNKES